MFATDSTDLSELPLELIERRLAELASQVYAGTCRWLEYVAEFDRRAGWAGTGCLSSADWIAWRCAVSPRAAREHVRVARRLRKLPRIHAAFAAGQLSYSKVRPLTRVADPESEDELLELAGHATAAQLERMLAAYRRVTSEQADLVNENAYVGYSWEEDGSLTIRARLAPEQGAAFLRAMEASQDSIWEQRTAASQPPSAAEPGTNGSAEPPKAPQMGGISGSAEPLAAPAAERPPAPQPSVPAPRPTPSPPITNVEAFAALVEAARTSGPVSTAGGERYLVSVHVDADTLVLGADGRCALGDGPALAPETARKLACDAALIRIVERDGKPLSVGRKTRTISPALRRALEARDQKCRFPGCERRRFLDAHHIESWADGGETSLENTALFCRPHHDCFHEGGFTLDGDANGDLNVRSPRGMVLCSSPPLQPSEPDSLIRTNREGGIAIDSETVLAGTGEKMNLGYAVDAVIAAVGSG